MKVLRSCALVGTLMASLLMAAPSEASVLPLLQTGINTFEDNDYETLVNNVGPANQIDVGDWFVGAIVFQGINGVGTGSAGNSTISAVFAIEVTGKTGADGAATQLQFGPLGSSSGADNAIALWSSAVLPGLGDLPAINSNSTMAAVYDHPDFAGADPDNGLDAFDDDFAGTTLLAEFGFLGDAGEFWVTNGNAGIDIPADILGLSASNEISLNVTFDPAGFPIWGKHDELFPIATALQGTGTFVRPQLQNPGVFQLATDTDFIANIVPEATSIAAWSVLSLLGGIAVRRSRRVNGRSNG